MSFPIPLDMCFSTALYFVRSYKATKANSCHFTDSFHTGTGEHVRSNTCSLEFIQVRGAVCGISTALPLFRRPFKLRLLGTSRLLPFQWLVVSTSPEPSAGGHCLCHTLQDSSQVSGDGSWSPDHMGYQTRLQL